MALRQFHLYKSPQTNKQEPSDSSDFSNLNDVEIWKSFTTGSDEALVYIYSKYIDALFNFGCQCTHNHELVKDCIQDVFLSLRKKPNHTLVKNIKAYLYKCLRREIVRALKKQYWLLFNTQVNHENWFRIDLGWDEKVIQDQVTQDNKVLLEKAITKLNSKQREAILYYYFEGFTYTEIADIMGMKSVVTARKLIYRAIDSLKSVLNKENQKVLFCFLV